MGIAINSPSISSHHQKKTVKHHSLLLLNNSVVQFSCSIRDSMSENYEHHHHHHHQSIFSFTQDEEVEIQRDKLRIQQGFAQPPSASLVGIDQQQAGSAAHEDASGLGSAGGVYETAGMLSEMFNFGVGAGGGGGEILDHHQQITGMSTTAAESAAAMQLFLTHPQHRSPSPPPPSNNSPLHMLLPNNQSTAAGSSIHHGYHHHHDSINQNPHQFSWTNHPAESSHHGGVGEGGQGLSLSLSSSLQRLDVTKAEEIRIGEDHAGGMLFFGSPTNTNHHHGPSSSNSSNHFKDLEVIPPGQHHQHHMMQQHHQLQAAVAATAGGGLMSHLQHHQQVHLGFGPSPSPSPSSSSSLAVVNILRNSRYTRPTLELLEEFCSVGRGYNLVKKGKLARNNSNNTATSNTSGGGGGNDPSSSNSGTNKDLPPLSPADRMEHQRRKVKLLSMLDEVERRYSHYCEQMQMVMNSFDLVMGFGAASPYTALAQKAMSRHFRCLKDAIQGQLKHSCELLGEKDVTGSSGLSKGETPRLKVVEQSLRQQRAFHQMGMMDQEAWRPQRGLPERSVNVLRAWLFEHFLHPYPNDADKHLLSRQTGLSRNQVSNWFINARVRLWKPMVEEMYQQEARERERVAAEGGHDHHHRRHQQPDDDEKLEAAEAEDEEEEDVQAAVNLHSTVIAAAATAGSISDPTNTTINAENDPSYGHISKLPAAATISRQQHLSFSDNQQRLTPPSATNTGGIGAAMMSTGAMGPAATNADDFFQTITAASHVDACNDDYGTTSSAAGFPAAAAAYHHPHHQNRGGVLLGNAAAVHHDRLENSSLGPTLIRFGTSGVVPTGGDVSLTLGLRHGSGSGGGGGNNASEKNNVFNFGDFGS